MIVLPNGEDCCRGGEHHTICGFYDSSRDKCYFGVDGLHGRSCTLYCADDSCMFCGVRKEYKCVVTLDFISPEQKRCDCFKPIDINKFTR